MEAAIDIYIEVPEGDSLVIASPSTLNELTNKISVQASYLPKPIYLLYERRNKWYKISDNLTYQKIIKDALKSNKTEMDLKVAPNFDDALTYRSSSSQSIASSESEMKKSDCGITQQNPNANGIYYRYINGPEPENVKFLQIVNFSIWLSNLSTMIVQREGFDAREWVCAIYSEDGSPVTGSLEMMQFVKVNEVLVTKSTVLLYIVPNFDIKSAEKKAPYGNDRLIVTREDKIETHNISIDLKNSTVLNMKQVLFHATNIPTYEIELQLDNSILHNNEVCSAL